MEAYAALRLKKKQEAQAQAALQEKLAKERQKRSALSHEELRRANQALGYPDPPKKVFALGKDGKAAVWWFCDNTEGITGWEVLRYRRHHSEHVDSPEEEWQLKGSTAFEALPRMQVVVDELTNGHEYRFTVCAVNAKGKGCESAPSNEVVVESALPPGWCRFFDKHRKRHYYASLQTGRSSWTRPDADPFFLEDEVYKHFSLSELQHLKGLYVEDMEHFRCITVERFMDVLQEIGESGSKNWIGKLFQAYSKNDFQDRLTTWQEFMLVVNHIKQTRMKPSLVTQPLIVAQRLLQRAQARTMLSGRNKMGDWVKEHNAFAERDFYRNVVTGEVSWSVPDPVKFYLAPRFEQRLLRFFDYGQLEEFKQHFSLLDVDDSGTLSEKEIQLLLRAMGIRMDVHKVAEILRAIDVNGDGVVQFDEFCYLMYELCRKDKVGVFKDIKSTKAPETDFFESAKRRMSVVDLSKTLNFSEDFNFAKLGSAIKGMRDSRTRYNSLIQEVNGNTESQAQRKADVASNDVFCAICLPFLRRGHARVDPVPPTVEGSPNTSLKRQERASRRSSLGTQKTLNSSVKKRGRSTRNNNEFDEDSDLSDPDGPPVPIQRSLSFEAIYRGGSMRSEKGHGPYCMCGCRRK